MNTIIQINKIPWIFQYLIPTQLEVDGIKYPLNQIIELKGISKSYGHYRLKLVFFGIIKSKVIIIEADQEFKFFIFKFQNKYWYYYLISYCPFPYLFFLRYQHGLGLVIIIFLSFLIILIELLMGFVSVKEIISD